MATHTFNIDQPSVSLNQGDKLTFKLVMKGASSSNFTASISQGSLRISSLAASTGYASTNCSYFDSSSISSSISSGNRNVITFSPGVSNFHNNNYLFVPNPLTGSENSLYTKYGDVDYEFSIKPYDIILTYLSDNTYIESRVLNVATSGSLLQVTIDNQLSNLYYTNLISGSYQSFLVLSRVEDETNAYLTFRKREGSTSYGFIIPQNLSSTVLTNIDTITKEVKQKILSDQSQITINTF